MARCHASVVRVGLGVAAAAVAAAVLTGCAATTTSGQAAAPVTATRTTPVAAADCTQGGASAAAAGATVRCYLGALAVADTNTACSVLSQKVREQIAADASYPGDTSSAYHVPTGDDPVGVDGDCATVAPLMQRALDALSASQRAEFEAALDQARVGATSITGSSASVAITLTANGRSAAQSVALVQDGGGWKVDSASAFSVGS